MQSAKKWDKAPDNGPRGVAVAVAFDRAILTLSVTILVRAVVQYGDAARQTAAAAFLLLLLGLPLATLGEALIVSLIGAGNLIGVIADLRALLGGVPRWSVSLPSLILVGFVVRGLTRQRMIAWFAETAPIRARWRHGGRWLPRTIGVGIVAGLLAAAISFI